MRVGSPQPPRVLANRSDAEVADRAEQPQPDDLVGVGHRDQRGEISGQASADR